MNTLTLVRLDLASLPPGVRVDVVERSVERLAGTPAVVLQTCERLEVYASGAASTPVFAGGAVSTCVERGADAFRHLVRVASGLESRIPGEPHVLGQVRAALAAATQTGRVPLEVQRAFAAAIRCARYVRERSALGLHEGGYASRAVEAVTAMLPAPAESHVVVVGSGTMARDVALRLAAASVGRLTVAGRHSPSVEQVAREAGAAAVALDRFLAGAINCDAVVAAVSARLPMLSPSTLRVMGARLLVDLGAVPYVTPDHASDPTLRILRLDDLRPGDRSESFAVAEALVERAVARYVSAPSALLDGWRARRAS